MQLFKRTALILPLSLATALLTACPDTQGRFDEFGVKTEDARQAGTNNQTPNTAVQVDFSGRYFMAIATSLELSKPIFFDTTVEVDENFVAKFTFQPLKTDLDPFEGNAPRPDARTPVGDPIIVENVQLTEEGTFSLTLENATVAGEANPISGGQIVATLTLNGYVLSTTSFCGTLAGDLKEPFPSPLTGSFGAGIVTDETMAAFEPVSKCEGGIIPEPDMGDDADMGDDMDEDMEVPPAIRCPEALEGDYLLTFHATGQASRNQVRLTLETSTDDTICYTGTVTSLANDAQIGTVEFARETDGIFLTKIPDFAIPAGATPILPDGGEAQLDLTASHWTTEGSCGTLQFSLVGTAISLPGNFAIIRQDSTKFTIQEAETAASCNVIIPNEACGLDAFAGDYNLKFETAASAGNPTLLTLELATHPLTCLQGQWVSKTDGSTLATLQEAFPLADDQLQLNMRNFRIPPGANPILPNGGTADVTITSTTAVSTAPANMCGTVVVSLFQPFELDSAGTFAALVGSDPAEARCPE